MKKLYVRLWVGLAIIIAIAIGISVWYLPSEEARNRTIANQAAAKRLNLHPGDLVKLHAEGMNELVRFSPQSHDKAVFENPHDVWVYTFSELEAQRPSICRQTEPCWDDWARVFMRQ